MILSDKKFPELVADKEFEVRFSEVDSMGIVWHGSYPLYFEDGREAFGAKYGLAYMDIFSNGCYAPLVDLSFKFLRPLRYPMRATIRTRYVPTDAAKIVFEYEILHDGERVATGRSVQVFMDREYRLMWDNPQFYEQWKIRMLDSVGDSAHQ